MANDLSHLNDATRKRNPELFSSKSGSGMLQAYAFTLYGRPVSTKNSRILGGGRSHLSKAARTALKAMQRQLRDRHPGPPLQGRYDLCVTVYYGNLKSWLDTDNALNFTGDLIKGILVPDDKPAHLRDWTCRPRLSRNEEERMLIELWEVPTSDTPV